MLKVRWNLEQTVITYNNLPACLLLEQLVFARSQLTRSGLFNLALLSRTSRVFIGRLSGPWNMGTETLPTQRLERDGQTGFRGWGFVAAGPLGGANAFKLREVFLGFQIKRTLMWRCDRVSQLQRKVQTKHVPRSHERSNKRTKNKDVQFMIHGERNKAEKNPQFVFSPVRLRAAEEWPPCRWWCEEVVCLSQKERLYSSRPESCASGPISTQDEVNLNLARRAVERQSGRNTPSCWGAMAFLEQLGDCSSFPPAPRSCKSATSSQEICTSKQRGKHSAGSREHQIPCFRLGNLQTGQTKMV